MALVNEGFAAYVVWVSGLSGKVDDLVVYLVVTCDDMTSTPADDRVTHRKVLQSIVSFI